MRLKLSQTHFIMYLVSLLAILVLSACGGHKTPGNQDQQERLSPDIPKLDVTYTKLLCCDFKATQEIAKDYQEQIQNMQNSMISALKEKAIFESVNLCASGQDSVKNSLVIEADITNFNIVGFWKRGFTPWARSWIELDLIFIDNYTQEIVRKKKISSANNPMAAYWGLGGTDRSLPSDMGKMLAEYISLSMPLSNSGNKTSSTANLGDVGDVVALLLSRFYLPLGFVP